MTRQDYYSASSYYEDLDYLGLSEEANCYIDDSWPTLCEEFSGNCTRCCMANDTCDNPGYYNDFQKKNIINK